MSFECIDVCGLQISRATEEEVVRAVDAALGRGEGGWLLTANVDHLRRAARDLAIRDLYRNATLSVADGAPVVWASRVAGRPLPERVAGSDLVFSLARMAAARGSRLYLLGGEGDVSQRAARALQQRTPGLVVVGASGPWFSLPPDPAALARTAEEVAAARPDLVYVAMPTPKQEYVMIALRERLPRAWLLGCGISFAFITGDVVRAPLWMQRNGLEWLHRLVQEPGRLAGRYLRDNLPFTLRLLALALRDRIAAR